jgi:hypothetical protein
MARALTWRDLPALPRFHKQKMFLDNALRLTYNPGLFSSSLLSIITPSSGFCTVVEPIESSQHPFLIGQVVHTPEDQTARLSLLAPGDQDHRGFLNLLAFMSSRIVEQGALQILAEVGKSSLEETILSQAGFRPYAEQQIWKLPRRFFYGTGKKAWIPITRADAEQVLSTFQRVVPLQVQRVEAPPDAKAIQGLLSWKEGRIVGIALLSFGPTGILVDLVIEPDLDELDDYLGALFFHLPYRNSRDIFLRIRSYQQPIASVLERAGAVVGPEQNAVVKRLAVHYNAKQTFRVQGFENQPDITTPISNTKVKN